MDDKLHGIKDVLQMLHDNGEATFGKRSFHEAVERGQIPYHRVDGIKKKLYRYSEVVNAIKKAGIGRPPEDNDSVLPDIPALPEVEDGQSEEDYINALTERLRKKPSLTDANILKAFYDTQTKKFDLDVKQGLYVLKSDVENQAFNVARHIRNKLLSVPERLSNELATIDDSHQIKELLYKEMNIILVGFSEESFSVADK